MKINRSTVETVGAFMSKQGAMTVARMLVGVMLGATIGLMGTTALSTTLPAVFAISVGVVGLTALAHTTIQRQKNEQLLDTYREEVGHILGKNEKQLTVDDLELAAKGPKNPNGSTALRMAMDYHRETRNFYIGSQAATAGLMATALLLVNEIPAIPTYGLAGAAGLLYNELFRTVTNTGALLIDSKAKGALTNEINSINHQISMGGRVSATRVLGVLLAGNPDIKEAIEQQYGQPYNELSIADKRNVVNTYDSRTNVVQLTRDINAGHILPTELAFVAFRESSGTPRREEVPEMHMYQDADSPTHWEARILMPQENYVDRMHDENNDATNTHLSIN